MAVVQKIRPDVVVQDVRTIYAVVSSADAQRALEDWARVHSGAVEFLTDWVAFRTAKIDVNAAVVVEAGDDSEITLGEIEALLVHASSRTDVIVLLAKPSGAAIRRMFRAGAKDVPASASELAVALKSVEWRKSVAAQAPAASVAGKIVCVLKTAGGVGGTMISTNIAREFVRFGVGNVALFDLDMQFGGVDSALDLNPPLNLTDAIVAADRLDAAMLRQIMVDHASGVRTLAAARTIAPIDAMSDEFARDLCRIARSSFNLTVLDMPIAWAPWFASVLAASDVIVPVVEPTVRSANGAMRIVNALDDLDIRVPAKTIIPVANRTTKTPNARDRLKMLEEILRVPCAIQIREDAKTCGEAADVGRCLRDMAPAAPVTLEIESAARAIAKAAGFDITETTETAQRFALPWRRQ